MHRAPALAVHAGSPPAAGLDPVADAAFAARLRAVAVEVSAVAATLGCAGPGMGARGEAGLALAHLVDAVGGDVRALAAECDDVAGRLALRASR